VKGLCVSGGTVKLAENPSSYSNESLNKNWRKRGAWGGSARWLLIRSTQNNP